MAALPSRLPSWTRSAATAARTCCCAYRRLTEQRNGVSVRTGRYSSSYSSSPYRQFWRSPTRHITPDAITRRASTMVTAFAGRGGSAGFLCVHGCLTSTEVEERARWEVFFFFFFFFVGGWGGVGWGGVGGWVVWGALGPMLAVWACLTLQPSSLHALVVGHLPPMPGCLPPRCCLQGEPHGGPWGLVDWWTLALGACCAALCCAVLCCAVLCACPHPWCAVLRCAVLRGAVLCCAAPRCAVLCCAALCCAVLCCAVLC